MWGKQRLEIFSRKVQGVGKPMFLCRNSGKVTMFDIQGHCHRAGPAAGIILYGHKNKESNRESREPEPGDLPPAPAPRWDPTAHAKVRKYVR